MIYVEDNPKEAKSFTDETSPRKPVASDRKVSIHGQVVRELSLKWFHDLMKLYPGENPEVKSTRILEEFHNLPLDFRERTWVGMKHVIINIVDSLSYQTDLKQILRDIYKTWIQLVSATLNLVSDGQAAIASVQQCYFNDQAKGSTDDWLHAAHP